MGNKTHTTETLHRSSLRQARGLGAGGHAGSHWLQNRISQVAFLIMGFWFVLSIPCAVKDGTLYTLEWIENPFNAVMLILFLISGLWHNYMVTTEVFEDYISCKSIRLPATIGLQLASVIAGVAGIFAILRLAI